MKKVTLAGLGILTISALTLGAQGAYADAVTPEATSEATVQFAVDEDGTIIVPPTGEGDGGSVNEDKSDGHKGDGNPSFNIAWVSNFRFNERKAGIADDDFTQFVPINLNANGMKVWAKGTYLTLDKVDDQGEVVLPTGGANETIYKNIPNFVQVVDNRGKNSGWNLSVTAGDFEGKDADNNPVTLTGAEISLHDPKLKGPEGIDIPSALAPTAFGLTEVKTLSENATNLMSAEPGAGTGSWSLKFGQEEKVSGNVYETLVNNTGVLLTIPAKAQAKAGVAYEAKLNWVLTDGPTN